MIYIWLDESDKKGEFYSNFYGGIMINSNDYKTIIADAQSLIDQLGIKDEIKWQKVNQFHEESYRKIIDFVFDLLMQGKAKIRIFFRSNQYVPIFDDAHNKNEEFTILYYEFIKHSFGLEYCDYPKNERFVRLYLDEIPVRGSQIAKFKTFLTKLSTDDAYLQNGIQIRENEIIEVDSKHHLMLQFLDLILGAMCFRLNDKHKIKDPSTGKRGKRTILKEKFYKYIYSKIELIKPRFNIGISTGYTDIKEKWYSPYRHWNFIPKNSVRDLTKCK